MYTFSSIFGQCTTTPNSSQQKNLWTPITLLLVRANLFRESSLGFESPKHWWTSVLARMPFLSWFPPVSHTALPLVKHRSNPNEVLLEIFWVFLFSTSYTWRLFDVFWIFSIYQVKNCWAFAQYLLSILWRSWTWSCLNILEGLRKICWAFSL